MLPILEENLEEFRATCFLVGIYIHCSGMGSTNVSIYCRMDTTANRALNGA